MYKEKLDALFQKAPQKADQIISALKSLVKYQNFAIEEQILIQARNNGVPGIDNNAIMQKNKEKVAMHDKAIDGMVLVNMYAKDFGCRKVFDIEPTLTHDSFAKYEQNDHAKAAYMVAAFVNEYYNLNLQLERYDRALDSTTQARIKRDRITEDDYLGATFSTLPVSEYNEDRLDNAPEEYRNSVEYIESDLYNLETVLKDEESLNITLANGVEMSIDTPDNRITLKTNGSFSDHSGILTPETNAGFEKIAPDKVMATDVLLGQLKEIVRQNGGLSYQTRKAFENQLNTER